VASQAHFLRAKNGLDQNGQLTCFVIPNYFCKSKAFVIYLDLNYYTLTINFENKKMVFKNQYQINLQFFSENINLDPNLILDLDL